MIGLLRRLDAWLDERSYRQSKAVLQHLQATFAPYMHSFALESAVRNGHVPRAHADRFLHESEPGATDGAKP